MNNLMEKYKGKKHGLLTVLNFEYKKSNQQYYKFICDCGKEVIKNLSETKRQQKRGLHPVNCGCLKTTGKRNRNSDVGMKCVICQKKFSRKFAHSQRGGNAFCSNDCRIHGMKTNPEKYNPNFKDRNQIERFFAKKIISLRSSAKKRNKGFDLCWEDLYKLYVKQAGFCHYTG